MSVVCINWQTIHLHGEAWISHHRLRDRIFVQRRGWKVPSYSGLEYDQFDTPAAKYIIWLDDRGQARGTARLIPTTASYMIESLWPHMVTGPLPKSPVVWEASRFGCDHRLEAHLRRRVVSELICACQEYAINKGVQKFIGVMPPAIFESVIKAAGCPVTFAGEIHTIDGHRLAAAYIDVSPEVLCRVRRTTSVSGRVLGGLESPLLVGRAPHNQSAQRRSHRSAAYLCADADVHDVT